MLTETHGVLHGAQIPKTQGAGKYSDSPKRASLAPRTLVRARARARRVRIWCC